MVSDFTSAPALDSVDGEEVDGVLSTDSSFVSFAAAAAGEDDDVADTGSDVISGCCFGRFPALMSPAPTKYSSRA